MFYTIVTWIIRLTLKFYFRRIIITGYHHLPPKGAVIFVANHPSAFMDPMVVATCVGRSIYFLAAAEFFGKGLKSRIYTKYLNMIPVYRPSTMPNEKHNNVAIFSKCFELLGNGGALLVFPEGNSITEKRIRKLKTGVARIALGTKEYFAGQVDVEIIPIGLNYANPHRFQSDLYINIGKSISTKAYTSDQAEVVRLTNKVEEGLKETILHIENEALDSVVKKVELILKHKIREGNKTIALKKEDEFTFQQNLIKSFQTISENQPHIMTNIELKVDSYLKRIRDLGISDGSIAELSIFVSAREIFRLMFTLPLFLFGFSVNAIPYYGTIFYFRKLNLYQRDGFKSPRKNGNPAFRGSIAMGIGIVFFIVYYLILAAIIIWSTHYFWVGGCSLIAFYLAGLFTMRYIRWFALFKQKLKLRKLLSGKQEVFASLIVERREILKELKLITD